MVIAKRRGQGKGLAVQELGSRGGQNVAHLPGAEPAPTRITGRDVMASKDPLLQPYQLKHLTLKNRIMSTSHEPA